MFQWKKNLCKTTIYSTIYILKQKKRASARVVIHFSTEESVSALKAVRKAVLVYMIIIYQLCKVIVPQYNKLTKCLIKYDNVQKFNPLPKKK